MIRDADLRIVAASAVNAGVLKAEPLRDGDVSHVSGGAFVTVSVFVPDEPGLGRALLAIIPHEEALELLAR